MPPAEEGLHSFQALGSPLPEAQAVPKVCSETGITLSLDLPATDSFHMGPSNLGCHPLVTHPGALCWAGGHPSGPSHCPTLQQRHRTVESPAWAD